MICTSLADDGVEILGQRRGLDAYVTNGKTMGIPLLYPWANRLSASTLWVDGAVVSLDRRRRRCARRRNGLPIHGVLAAYPGWVVTARVGEHLDGRLDYGANPRLLASFPFPARADPEDHAGRSDAHHRDDGDADGGGPVPLCFGYHPYLTIPGCAARGLDAHDAGHAAPAHRRPGYPDRRVRGLERRDRPLGDITYDDGFDEVPDGAVFTLAGGDRRIEVTFEKGYPAAQLFAPPGEDLVAIEPMAAPTDALSRGNYRSAVRGQPGDRCASRSKYSEPSESCRTRLL